MERWEVGRQGRPLVGEAVRTHFALFSPPPSVALTRDVSSLEGFKPPFQPCAGPLHLHVLLCLQAAPAAPFLLVASPAGKSRRPDRLLFLTRLSLPSPARSRWPWHQAALHVSFQTRRACWAPHCSLLIHRHWPLGLPFRFRPCCPRLPPSNL